MDIIAAHRQGLIEQLDEEVAALAGHGRDHAQRAMVLHHLFDHSRGGHVWALAEAQRALRIAAGLAALRRRLDRWGWIGGSRELAHAALDQLAEALGEAARARAVVAYRAYRVSATRALRDEAEASLAPTLLDLLDQCHAARRDGVGLSPELQQALADESEQLAAAAREGAALDRAWARINATGLRRATMRMIGDKALARKAFKDQRRGATVVERRFRADGALPASFRANPAQHFYALQRMLQERRRQNWRDACDREPDAFELAA